MPSEQFIWRGNSTTQGYPLTPNITWPSARSGNSLWSSKNLVWMFGGEDPLMNYNFNDLSTFSDGM